MSIGELIHAYSYTYGEQIIDGLHGEQQTLVPPHLIDLHAGQEEDEGYGRREEASLHEGSSSHVSHSKRREITIEEEHARALKALRRHRRQLAREARTAREAASHAASAADNAAPRNDASGSIFGKRKRSDGSEKGKKVPRPASPAPPAIPPASADSGGSAAYRPPTAASFYIPTLPGLSPDSTLTLYGGHLPSTITSTSAETSAATPSYTADGPASDAHLFFFLAKAKHIAEKQKLVIWLNGGPGCSSFDGALMEIGPLRMVEGKKGELFEQDGAWNEYANVMFIDQPAGTGYSYVSKAKYVKSGEDAAKHVVTFLSNFYEVFPEYSKMDTYIAGESFAGIWIPYLAAEIQKTNLIDGSNLKGLIIGNGWMDPFNQYPAYVDFAYQENLLMKGTTATASLAKVDRILERCNKERERIGFDKFPINHGTCEGVLSSITETTLQVVNGQKLCVNNYDIRLTDTHPACGMNWPNLLPDMYAYLPRKDVVEAFHATARKAPWAECNGHVSDAFWGHTKPSVHLLPSLLESGIPIMLFSGMQDLICNHVGTEKMIENLSWAGGKGWSDGEDERNATQQDWWVDGKKAGTWQSARNLTYVQVYNSSHMVPFDVPVVAHDMLSRFIGTDYFIAAGASAKVPSRIGNEQEAIIGETHLNGSALDSSASTQQQATELEESAGPKPITDAYYNIGAALLVLFIIILVGLGFIWRQRRRRYRFGGFGVAGSKHSGGNGLPTTMSDGLNGHPSQHRRNRSSASDYRRMAGDTEEANELLPMDQREKAGSSTRNNVELPRGEELFSVGEEDEADSEEEGNIGKAGRKLSAISTEDSDGNKNSQRYDV